MPLNFPSNPAVNQIYVYNGIRWRWNGYGWNSAGICGALNAGGGICGDYVAALTGGTGITLTGPSGVVEISLKLDEPNIGPVGTPIQHVAPSTFNADVGIARKVAFLEADGSVSFDFIKNYDVFRQAEFNFDIVSFNIPGLNPQLIGLQNTYFSLDGFVANMSYSQTPIEGKINVLNTVNFTDSQGFPAIIPSFNLSTFVFNSSHSVKNRTLTYNNTGTNNDFYNIQLGVTGESSDNTQIYKTKNYTLYFYNHIMYAEIQAQNINNFNDYPFIKVLNGSRNYTINITMSQNASNPYFLYYAYPARLGTASFRDNSTNLEGGFVYLGTLNYTNSRSYTESYNVYRSEQSNLGQVSITVL